MKYFIIILIIALNLNLSAQVVEIPWQNCLGGSDNDDAGWFDDAIVKLSDGYLILSETESIDGDVNSNTFERHNIWILKTDFYGNLIWEKVIGGSDGSSAYTLTKYNDSTFYIFGVTASTDGDVQSGNQGLGDNWIVKINDKGDILWEKTFGGDKNDKRGSLQLTEEGDILVFTETWSTIGDFGINDLPGYDHLWFYKIDQTGKILWSELYGGDDLNRTGDFLQTSDGGYLLVATCRGNEDAGCICEHNNPGLSIHDIWVMKLDKDRNIEWQDCYGGSDSEQCFNVIEEDFGYTLAGFSYSSDGDVGFNFYETDIWLLQIDQSGNILKSLTYGGGDDDYPDAIFKNEETGGYTIIGTTKSNNGDVSGNYCTQWDCRPSIWYVVLDSLGNIDYQKCIGNTGDQIPGGVLKLDEGRFIVSASATRGEGGEDLQCDFHFPYSNDDIWFFDLLDCNQNPPIVPSQPIGQDTICTISTTETIYTTKIGNHQLEEVEWQMQPSEAGELTNLQDSVIIQWNSDFEGQVELSVRSSNSCGESNYSEPKIITVRSCVGVGEIHQKQLKVYPNPANNQITFELPQVTKESLLQIKDVFGKTVNEVSLLREQAQFVWDCSQIPRGVFFYQTEINGEVYRGKILIQK
jgi:hypothetical protein